MIKYRHMSLDQVDQFSYIPKEVDIQLYANEINNAMRNGESVFDYLDKVRAFPRPIVVDFNNVLASNRLPVVPNPKGADFIAKLRKTGSVFITTTATDWLKVQKVLEEGNMWSDKDVLLVEDNWRFLKTRRAPGPILPQAQEAILEYTNLVGRYTQDDFNHPSGYKRVAPLFLRTFDVPIIDDFFGAFQGNPGMLGIGVEVFEPTEPGLGTYPDSSIRISLEDAAEQVRNHYEGLMNEQPTQQNP